MVTRRQAIEAALAAWRESQRQVDADGDDPELRAEMERHRSQFHRLSAEHMIERIDALREAEGRRRAAEPSTPPFHEAARDEQQIAAEIWDHARASDEDVPRRGDEG